MILVVDDDPSVRTSLALLLKQQGYSTCVASCEDEALALLSERDFELVLQDMNFSRDTSGKEGLALLSRIRSMKPHQLVILITAWGSIGLAVEGVKAGAADFLTKPWDNEHLARSVETVLSLQATHLDDRASSPSDRLDIDAKGEFLPLVGEDPKLLSLLDLIARVAPTDASVLITGESGTGKELVAEALHVNSKRADQAFVKVNLGGISSTLFESEMFGHVRGAFTDAREDRVGRFELASGGTIFLDEVGDLDLSAQVKLLRVLQDRTYEVLGSSHTRKVDVRVVAATNRDLNAMVASGGFREDLLYRLNLMHLRLPPLRERRGDIGSLAAHLLARCAEEHGRSAMSLDDSARAWLKDRKWPGNVRQLRQVLERALLVFETSSIGAEELDAVSRLDDSEQVDDTIPLPGSMTLDEMECRMVADSLAHNKGNVTRAAEDLGLSRAALYRRIERHGLSTNG